MKRNVGSIDRGIRLAVGVVLIYFTLVNTSLIDNQVIRYIVAAYGGINIITGILAFCPMYHLANLSTLRKTSS